MHDEDENHYDGYGNYTGYTRRRVSDLPGACFVATAVYGDINHPQVCALRRIRDKVLRRNVLGRAFVNFYYSGVGKTVAELVKQKFPRTIPTIQAGLDRVIDKFG